MLNRLIVMVPPMPANLLTIADNLQAVKSRRVKALLLSDRIDTSNLEHDGVVSTAPLTYKFGKDGFVTLFRYGVAVVMGLTPREEDEVLRSLRPRLIRPVSPSEEETVQVEVVAEKEDQILPGGPIVLKTLTPEHLIVIADALSKSVVLARDEREVAAVFELVEPFARQLAENGRAGAGRRAILRHVGNTLLVQHRVSGRVAVVESRTWSGTATIWSGFMRGWKTNTNLKERADALSRKLVVIAETAEVLTDIIDTKRTLRLEIIIVILIAVELVFAGYQTLH